MKPTNVSPLKSDSRKVVKDLRAGGQDVVMVTGDALLTAAEVARRVGIIPPKAACYELSGGGRDGGFVFRKLGRADGGGGQPGEELECDAANYAALRKMRVRGSAAFCATGDALTRFGLSATGGGGAFRSAVSSSDDERHVLQNPAARKAVADLVPLVSVFARHAPRHKEAVVAAYNEAGRHTLFCGDGTNDGEVVLLIAAAVPRVLTACVSRFDRYADSDLSRSAQEGPRRSLHHKRAGRGEKTEGGERDA